MPKVFFSPGDIPCCICDAQNETVRNIIMLGFKRPGEGPGWGCVVCNLPSEGASSIICDRCIMVYGNREAFEPYIKYILGPDSTRIEMPPEDKREPHLHDNSYHLELSGVAVGRKGKGLS